MRRDRGLTWILATGTLHIVGPFVVEPTSLRWSGEFSNQQGQMSAVPLFNFAELKRAFALILPEAKAEEWAKEWWAVHATESDLDSAGNFLFEDWPDDEKIEVAFAASKATNAEYAWGFESLRERSDDELGEFLMSFTDFHLNLLSLVSPELFERVKRVRGDSNIMAERRRRQMLRIVDVIGRH